MRYAISSLVLLWACLVGCGKESAATTPGGPAGEVVALSGTVTATRNDETRDLKVGAEVFADDTVKTAEDARVEIVLSHNNAHWVLDGGLERRVDTSIAWRAEKQTGTQLASTDENRTGAAGRHTEKEAAQTRAETTGAGAAPDPKDQESPPEVTATPVTATKPPPPPPPTPKPPPIETNQPVKKDGFLEKPKEPKAALRAEVTTSSASGALSKSSASKTIAGASVGRCAKQGTRAATVTVDLLVSKSGAVSEIRASAEAGKAFAACVRKVLLGRKFEGADGDTKVKVTIKLSAIE